MKRTVFTVCAFIYCIPAYSMQHMLALLRSIDSQAIENRQHHYKKIFEADNKLVTLNGKQYKRALLPKDNQHEVALLERTHRFIFNQVIELRREPVVSLRNSHQHDYYKIDKGLRINVTGKLLLSCMTLALVVYYMQYIGVV